MKTVARLLIITGKVFENVGALEEYIDKIQEAAKQEAYADAIKTTTKSIVTQESKYQELGATLYDLRGKYVELQQKQKEAIADHDNEKIAQYTDQLGIVKGQMDEVTASLGNMGEKLLESNQKLADYTNQLETGGLKEIGDTLKSQLQEVVDTAAEDGYKIPKNLTDGIMNGTESYTTARDFITQMLTFQQLTENAGQAGLAIPAAIAESIVENAGSVSEANTQLNNMIEFNEAVQKAGYDGLQVSPKVAEAIASNQISVSDAMKALGKGGVDELEKELDKSKDKASKKSKDIGDKLGDGKSNAKASSGSMGKSGGISLFKAYEPYAKATIDYAKKVEKALHNAKEAAKDPIIITTIKKTVHKTEKQSLDNLSRPVVDSDVAPMSADSIAALADTSAYAVASDATTSIMGGTVSRSNSTAYNLNLDGIYKRMDNLTSALNAILDSNITINLQPMQLDGNVVTDTVQEIISIRDMLKSWGNGGS